MICEIWSFCIQNILRMVFDLVHLQINDDILQMFICNVSLVKLLNNPLLHALNVCTQNYSHYNNFRWKRMFTFWLFNKIYFIREKNSRVQRTKFYESHRYFGDALGPVVEKKNESREKWRPFYFILFRK
jgi:hypothetical protein